MTPSFLPSDLITADTSISDTDEGTTKPDGKVVCKIPKSVCPQPEGMVKCQTPSGQIVAEQESPCLKWQDTTCKKLEMRTKKDSPQLPDQELKFERAMCTKPDGTAL